MDRLFGRAVVTRQVAAQSGTAIAKVEPKQQAKLASQASASPKTPGPIPGTPTGNA